MQYILIADDNPDITSILSLYAQKEGFEPVVAADGEEAVRLFHKYNPVVVLLDVMMPKEDGYEVCRKIRAKSDVPVILVTARGEDFEKIMGLDIGADDYIVKPFSPSEVMARVRAVLRRMTKNEKESNANVLRVADLEINLEEYTLSIGEKKMSLTKKEIETMWTLASNPNKVFTRDNLLDSLWALITLVIRERWTPISSVCVQNWMPYPIRAGILRRSGALAINLRLLRTDLV